MTDEERVLRDFYDAFNTNELERAAAQFAPECEYAFIAFGPNRAQRTRQEVLEGLQVWRASFPDGG